METTLQKTKLRTLDRVLYYIFPLLIPFITVLCTEWNHRGTLDAEFIQKNLLAHTDAFVLAWLFLVFIYIGLSHLFCRHWPAVLLTGVFGNLFGIISYYKLAYRSEPFLPWDLSQIQDLMDVSEELTFSITPSLAITAVLLLAMTIGSGFVRFPSKTKKRRFIGAGVGTALTLGMIFGVYLQPTATLFFGIKPDYWMQDRYYRNYGAITGFMTNLQALNIKEPKAYSQAAVEEIEAATEKAAKTQTPLFGTSYAATTTAADVVQQPNIIYVMNESFYDVQRLEGITFSEPLTPTLDSLRKTAATGYCYSPSFGGGTCDVEFEALTGFSLSYLPSGIKPYQQHVTHDMFSIAQYLRTNGYDTVAVHGYYARFWSRSTAYPHLGFNDFIAKEQFVEPALRRGFISDAAMTQRIIEEYEARGDDAPVFIHAVTMQNHTTYSEDRYPADELVEVTSYPEGMSEKTLSQLRDFATGVKEADAALGQLIDYFKNVDEPTIIVFWGDHMNPIGSSGNSYELFTSTGYIEKGDTSAPQLHLTDLAIWSNYGNAQIDLGTIAAYQISPVMMDLYGLEKPLMFQYLSQEFNTMRAHTGGVTVQPDGSFSDEMTEKQETLYNNRWLLQYDYMFGKQYLEDYTPAE